MQKQLIIDSYGLIHDVKQQFDFIMWAIDHFATTFKGYNLSSSISSLSKLEFQRLWFLTCLPTVTKES